MSVLVKICGLKTPGMVDAALEADASLRAGLSIRGGEVIDTRILA